MSGFIWGIFLPFFVLYEQRKANDKGLAVLIFLFRVGTSLHILVTVNCSVFVSN